ncbi:MAG: hypothetical protein L3K09_01560 [Thermoplasmata archaeon]|nr:hypothetical protein [Thermoplasmata archaeon]
MDVPLYGIALAVFAVLYLAIGVFLAYVLIITLVVMFLYLALRHGSLPDNYPHGLGDTLITVIFIGVTWGIFTYLAPKPIPFVGKGFTYTNAPTIPVTSILEISLLLALVFLVIGAFIAKDLKELPSGGSSGGGEKPKQGVGA